MDKHAQGEEWAITVYNPDQTFKPVPSPAVGGRVKTGPRMHPVGKRLVKGTLTNCAVPVSRAAAIWAKKNSLVVFNRVLKERFTETYMTAGGVGGYLVTRYRINNRSSEAWLHFYFRNLRGTPTSAELSEVSRRYSVKAHQDRLDRLLDKCTEKKPRWPALGSVKPSTDDHRNQPRTNPSQ